jgi:sulfite reductase (NADPH) hemoprotein beta-component
MSTSVITANRLRDGVSVWLGASGSWVEEARDAALFDATALPDALARARAAEQQNLIVDLHDAPADGARGPVVPSTMRERIRAEGPSVRSDLGPAGRRAPRPADAPVTQPPTTAAPFAGLYRYDEYDRQFLRDRAAQFRAQVARRIAGELSEDEFKPLRLMNGLYLQLHAYMLRIAIPYGVLSSAQLRQLALVARTYDRGYGHFTTRQNCQFNWLRLEDAPDALALLAEADLHGIQTSGNCVRNVTTDQFAGAAHDEIVDPRLYAEILRQWSTDHPEFTYLPRKFKIAISGSAVDRAKVRVHDIGILAKRDAQGRVGFEIHAGGGLGRIPIVATKVTDFVPVPDLLRWVEAILRVYNALGRRDNIHKARIKILVREMKPDHFVQLVETEVAQMPAAYCVLRDDIVDAVAARFAAPPFDLLPLRSAAFEEARRTDRAFATWVQHNTMRHRRAGYVAATISLKPAGGIPGDASAEEMDLIADLADRYSFGEIRVSHEQNLVLPHVRLDDLYALYAVLAEHELATGNVGLITNIIACPGLDYCSLATARSIPIAQRISERFAARQHEIGPLDLNISGCINACGHHHVGHIGLLGVDKAGEEVYQLTLGGAGDEQASIGSIIGPAFKSDEVVDAIEAIVDAYLRLRRDGERFIDTYRRLGAAPFKASAYREVSDAAD